MISIKSLLLLAMLPLVSAFIGANPAAKSGASSTTLNVIMPRDGLPNFNDFVNAKEPVMPREMVPAEPAETKPAGESLVSTIMTANAVMLGFFLVVATLAPTPVVDAAVKTVEDSTYYGML